MSEQDDNVDWADWADWADDDLVRALRAPGTATELADEQEYVAAFREAQAQPPRRAPSHVVRSAGSAPAGPRWC